MFQNNEREAYKTTKADNNNNNNKTVDSINEMVKYSSSNISRVVTTTQKKNIINDHVAT